MVRLFFTSSRLDRSGLLARKISPFKLWISSMVEFLTEDGVDPEGGGAEAVADEGDDAGDGKCVGSAGIRFPNTWGSKVGTTGKPMGSCRAGVGRVSKDSSSLLSFFSCPLDFGAGVYVVTGT